MGSVYLRSKMSEQREYQTRRDVLRGLVAVGGATALSACLDMSDGRRTGTHDPPSGKPEPEDLPERQHAWDEFSKRDSFGNVRPPRHHVLVLANYASNGPPKEEHREQAKAAFGLLEEAYEWSNEGLLFTVSYSPSYFDRYDEDLSETVDVPEPRALVDSEDPTLDTPDMVVHLASDQASVVLEAEQALFGERDTVNTVEMTSDVRDILARVERRTGFIGAGLPAENDTVSGVPEGAVPEEAPLFMGFASGFTGNQAPEEAVTITDGPFEDGTTQQISSLQLSLEQWYNQDSREQRVSKMFSPRHTDENLVEGVGDNLGASSKIMEVDGPANTENDAFEEGVVGHAQKTARARKDGVPRMLRRDFDTTDGGRAGLYFLSLQETIQDFVVTREAMFGEDVANIGGVGTTNNNGILQYIKTETRGNYLIPPRSKRAFPRSN